METVIDLFTILGMAKIPSEKPVPYYKRIGAVSKNIYLDRQKQHKLYALSEDIARRPSWVIYVLIDMLLEGEITIEEVEKFGLRKKKKGGES